MGVKILLCEDEPAFLEGLKEEIIVRFENCGAQYDFFCCKCAEEFRKVTGAVTPDLIFMDICLEDGDGMQLIETYRKGEGAKVPVVFVSSMEDRVLEGYEVNALAFLYKRNYRDKLDRTLERFWKEYATPQKLTLQNAGQVEIVAIGDITYIETDGRKTLVHTQTGSSQDERTIGHFVEMLPKERFFEVYKAVYVNLEHVNRINEDTILLDNGDKVPMSRRKRKQAVLAVMQYIGGR